MRDTWSSDMIWTSTESYPVDGNLYVRSTDQQEHYAKALFSSIRIIFRAARFSRSSKLENRVSLVPARRKISPKVAS